MIVTFECEIVDDYADEIIILSENDNEIRLKLNAFKPEPLINYDPFVNFGFVPVNSRKTTKISFSNLGMIGVNVELSSSKNQEIKITPLNFFLAKSAKGSKRPKQDVLVSYEPTTNNNVNDKIDIIDKATSKNLGSIELVGTSVNQQISIVFDQGGGPATEVSFGLLYFGQTKECNAFLVNNGPKEIEYNFIFYPNKRPSDINKNDDDYAFSPYEAGIEMTERILSTSPINGVIKPYSQLPVKFYCKTKFPKMDKAWRNNILLENHQLKKKLQVPEKESSRLTTYISTSAVRFEENGKGEKFNDNEDRICEPITVFMQATAILPQLVLDKTELNFWECPINEEKQILLKLSNINDSLSIDYEFNKVFAFQISQPYGVIPPLSEKELIISFMPKNLGKYLDALILKYISGMYEIEIKVTGTSSSLGIKENKLRGVEATDDHFLTQENILPDELATNYTIPNKVYSKTKNYKEYYLHTRWVNKLIEEKANSDFLNNLELKYKIYKTDRIPKIQSNQFLIESRISRKALLKKIENISLSNKAENIALTQGASFEKSNSTDLLETLSQTRCDSPKFKIPTTNEQLWVVNQIGKYEPIMNDNIPVIPLNTDFENKTEGKHPPTSPKNNVERSHCKRELTGYDLQKIEVSTKELNFGEMFKGSESEKPFYIKNNLQFCIQFELFIEVRDLLNTTPKKMVIQPGKTEVVNFKLTAGDPKRISTHVKYSINSQSTFKVKILCTIVSVSLKINMTSFKFDFRREKMENPSVRVSTSLELFNEGNSAALFNWDDLKKKCFSIEPTSGIVNPNTKTIVNFHFNPKHSPVGVDVEEDAKCFLTNGHPFFFKIIANVPRSAVFLSGGEFIDFGNVHIGVDKKNEFFLQNNQKNMTIWEIASSSTSLFFPVTCGYIRDRRISISCILNSNIEGMFTENVQIYIRGGAMLLLQVRANVVIPEVEILEQSFDFPKASYGETKVLKLTIKNNSELSAIVIIDLRSHEYKNFRIDLSNTKNYDKEKIIKLLDRPDKLKGVNTLTDLDENEDESEEVILDDQESRYFEVELAGTVELEFDFSFVPNLDINVNKIEVETNFMIKGYNEKVEGLCRPVRAEKIESKINTAPDKVEFVKTFIYEKPNIAETYLTLVSLDMKRIDWIIDTNELDAEGIFSCLNKSGTLMTMNERISITFQFCPKESKVYESKFYILVKEDLNNDNNNHNNTNDSQVQSSRKSVLQDDSNCSWVVAKTVTICGEGTKPRIIFDQKEVILPIVPLNIESKKIFKIKNEGFDLLKLNHRIICDSGNLPIEIKFLDGNKIGQIKQQIRIEVTMKSSKPISFTAKILFSDSYTGMEQYILVAGTTDNELLTNFSYFEKNNLPMTMNVETSNGNLIYFPPVNTITIKEKENEEKKNNSDTINDDNKSTNSDNDLSQSNSNNIATENLEIDGEKRKINPLIVYKNKLKSSCNYILSLMRFIFTDRAIYNFPEDFCDNKSDLVYIFEFIRLLSGTTPKGKAEKLEEETKAIQLRQQFYDLLKFLQENGASLSTVFPEYLLEFGLFKKYIAQDNYSMSILSEQWETKLKKIHSILHLENWILVVYQILKLFYVSRVNIKTFPKALKHFEIPANSDFIYSNVNSIPTSNVYSKNELILIKWMQLNFDNIFQNQLRQIKNFDEDLKDAYVIYSIISSYFPKFEETFKQKKKGLLSNVDSKHSNISYDKVFSAMVEYGINTHIMNADELLNLNPKEMIIFVTMLYQNLPLFNPKDTIIFSCILGDEVTKELTLANPSGKKVEYSIKKEGSEDFVIKNPQDIKLETATSTYTIYISFKSRIFEDVSGKIYLINKLDGMMVMANPLVYELKSNITARRSLGNNYLVKYQMYKKYSFSIPIKNPYKEKGDFKVRLEINRKIPNLKGKKPEEKIKYDRLQYSPLYRVFSFKNDDDIYNMRLEPEQSKELHLNFLPIDTCVYECNIIFFDTKAGEFQYTIEGQGEMPDVSDRFEFESVVEEYKELVLEIKSSNFLLDKSLDVLTLLEEEKLKKGLTVAPNYTGSPGMFRCIFSVESTKSYFQVDNKIVMDVFDMTSLKTKNQKSTPTPGNNNNINNNLPTNKNNQLGATNNNLLANNNLNLISKRQSFKSMNPNETGYSETNNKLGESSTNFQSNTKSSNKMIVKFHSKICSSFEGELILKNLDKPMDIRRIKIVVHVKPKNIYAQMEITCPIGQEIVQNIPFHNSTDKDWYIKADLTKNPGGFFSCPKDVFINRRSTENIALKFKPTEIREIKASLVLLNSTTKERYDYALLGIADDPLAEGKIEIPCKVREKQSRIIKIPNTTTTEITYKVDTDLADTVSGLPKFTVKPLSSFDYEIKTRPLLGKTYFGKITFTNESTKTYIWYTIKIEATSQYNVKELEMKCQIRKAIYTEFGLENPLNFPVVFNVEYSGEYLSGEKEFILGPKKSGMYSLIFSPLKVGKYQGRLHIYSELIGEVLCKINLIAEAPSINIPPLIKSELGKYTDINILLENPIQEAVEVETLIQHRNIYDVIPEKIILPPLSAREITIRYTPCSLETEEISLIAFETDKIGDWEYKLTGKGYPPSPMPKTTINTFVGGIISSYIYFKNPFNEKTSFTVELKCNDLPDTFKLINKKEKERYMVDSLKTFQIPFSFSPSKLAKYYAEVYVYVTRTLYWIFPIEGITEVKTKGISYSFKTKAKKMYENKITLDLNDILDFDIEKERFDFKVHVKDPKFENLISKCLNAEFGDIRNDLGNKLELYVKFFPLRPFKTECELIIIKKSGGQWVYDLYLEATDSSPDDILYIQSSLNKTAEISFKLNNIFTKTAEFISYFSHDSSAEFSVVPREGILDQAGRKGTNFIVSYLPVEYGKIKIAKLIIETDEIQWLFEIRGSHLDYKPPEIKHTDYTKTTQATTSRVLTTNYESNYLKTEVKKYDRYGNSLNNTTNLNNPNITARSIKLKPINNKSIANFKGSKYNLK